MFIIACLLSLYSLIGTDNTAPGNENSSWSISPAVTETHSEKRVSFKLELEPGETYQDAITIKNLSAKDLTLDLYAGDGQTTNTGDFDISTEDEPTISTGSWITLEAQTLTVPAGQSLDVPFTLTVPEKITPGDHPGGIVSVLSSQTQDNSQTRFISDNRLGTRIHLRVKGDVLADLKIENISLNYETNWNPIAPGSAKLKYQITNTGNIRLGYTHDTIIKSLGIKQGEKVTNTRREILPGETFEEEITVENVWPLFWTNATLTQTPQAVNEALTLEQLKTSEQNSGTLTLPIPQLSLALIVIAIISLLIRQHKKYKQLRKELKKYADQPTST